MTHYELPGLGLDGRNVDLVPIDAPFQDLNMYLRTGTSSGHGASKVLSGTGIAQPAYRQRT